MGIPGMPIDSEWGGEGATPLTTAIALDALGYACTDTGLVFSLVAHMVSCALPLSQHGSEEQ